MVFIFDECHRSQFGDNHKAIKEFFPNAQLFGFTGTPIFEQNASYQQIEGQQASYRTTDDIFQQQLHAYTITHAIEDRNVLRFHVDYYKPEGKDNRPKPLANAAKRKPSSKPFSPSTTPPPTGASSTPCWPPPASTTPSSTTPFQDRAGRKAGGRDPSFQPLNIACVFSPPAEGNKDVQQIQEDLPQEKADNEQEPDKKKAALKAIIADYNARYGTNHSIGEFDLYYQDVQKRIKDQQYPNADLPHAQKIDITIVVDMLLTGFDSKYLNTLYVDKNLKYHGLIQAFSRTNRVLNDSKPYGNILDFRQQQDAVDEAIALFSGEKGDNPREIWLVDAAPQVIANSTKPSPGWLSSWQSQGLANTPDQVGNLKGDEARAGFVNLFKDVQRLKTQARPIHRSHRADQANIAAVMPEDQLKSLPRRVSGNRQAPQGPAERRPAGRQQRRAAARLRVRALRRKPVGTDILNRGFGKPKRGRHG
jgi:type I restriction enzyme R subunit